LAMQDKLEQTVIDEHVAQVQSSSSIRADEAFAFWVYSLYFDLEEGAIPIDEDIDGKGEKQIDIVKIQEFSEEGRAEIWIFQIKNQKTFKSNSITLIANGLDWIFSQPRESVNSLTNLAFKNKIKEVRQIRQTYGMSNMDVNVIYASRGDTTKLGREHNEEANKLQEIWESKYFGEFEFRMLGASELMEMQREKEFSPNRINADLRIVYDVNQASLLRFNEGKVRAVLCTTTGDEIAKLVSQGPKNAIFEKNIRRFLGMRGRVNSEIHQTAVGADETAKQFWYMNNGITMTCDELDVVTDPDDAMIKLKNVQIVNGCQTAMTLRKAFQDGDLNDRVRLQVKAYESTNPDFVNKIVLATNNQNSIKARDLYSNDRAQIDIQKVMEERYGFYYERKANEFRDSKEIKKIRIIDNEKAGQAYLAMTLKRPTTARTQKYKIFSDELYGQIYEGVDVTKMLTSYLFYKISADIGKSEAKDTESEIRHSVCTYGLFHVTRIMGEIYFGTPNIPKISNKRCERAISKIEAGDDAVFRIASESISFMESVINDHIDEIESINNYFKSNKIQKDINEKLERERNVIE